MLVLETIHFCLIMTPLIAAELLMLQWQFLCHMWAQRSFTQLCLCRSPEQTSTYPADWLKLRAGPAGFALLHVLPRSRWAAHLLFCQCLQSTKAQVSLHCQQHMAEVEI